MKIPLYWCNINNFGDAINPLIFKQIGKMSVFKSNIKRAKVVGIGSLLDMFLQNNENFGDEEELFVWSSGLGFGEGEFENYSGIIEPEKLVRNIRCYALRGYLTKERLEKMTGKNFDGAVVADGGLLASYLVDTNKIVKKYNLGIVPHFADYHNQIFVDIKNKIENSIIIDITQNPVDFIKQLAQCECVVSTAMHALIAADALGIPNKWGRISERTTTRYKFYDYYSAFNVKEEPWNLLEKKIDNSLMTEIIDNYQIDYNIVCLKQTQLLESLCFMRDDLEYCIQKMNKEFCLHKLRRLIVNLLSLVMSDKNKRKKFRKKYG